MISKEVIEKCKNKERKAHKLCYEACAPYVYTIVKTYIYNEDLRKDAMQESFAHIFNSIHRFDAKKGSFKSWISSITVHQCITILKSLKKLQILVPIDQISEPKVENISALEKISRKDIENLFAGMPAGFRTIFLLYVIDGYTHQEISELLNIDTGTSRSQLSRSIQWINKHLLAQLKTMIYG